MANPNTHKLVSLLQSLKNGSDPSSISSEDRVLVQALLQSVRHKKESQTVKPQDAKPYTKASTENSRVEMRALGLPAGLEEDLRQENDNLKKVVKEKEAFAQAIEQQFAKIMERVESGEEVTKMTINYLNAQAKELQQEKDKLEIRYNELKESLAGIGQQGTKEGETFQAYFTDMQEKLEAWNLANETLKEKNQDLRSRCHELELNAKDEQHTLQSKIERLSVALENSEEKVQKLQADIADLQMKSGSELQGTSKKIEEVRQEYSQATAQVRQLEEEKRELQRETEKALQALKNAEQEAKQISKELKEQALKDSEEVVEAKAQAKHLSEELTRIKEEYAVLQRQQQISQQQKSESKVEEEVLIQSLKEQITVLRNENNRLSQQQQVSQQHSQVATAKDSSVESLQERIEALIGENNKLTQEQSKEVIVTDDSVVQSLRQQLDALTDEKNRLAQAKRETEDKYQELMRSQAALPVASTASAQSMPEYLALTQNFNQTYFQNFEKIKKQFTELFYFSHPSKECNGNLVHFTEKFGITYLVNIRAPFQGLEGQIFGMVANFTLNNIIRTKKYINSSRLIEEFFYAVRPSLMLLNEEKQERNIEVGVCLLDSANLEVEYASTGATLYYFQNKALKELHSSKQDDDSQTKRFGLNNAYQVKKLNLMKNDELVFISEETNDTLWKVIDSFASKDDHQRTEEIEKHLEGIRAKKDFLYVQIKL